MIESDKVHVLYRHTNMPFSLTILGSSSAIPTNKRYPSAQVLCNNNQLFLIDCGEGTQMQMQKYAIKANRINHIFISHMHGDHYFGLPGLISTFNLLGRTKDLHIYAPPELENILELQNKAANTTFRYKIIFHHLCANTEKLLYEDDTLSIEHVPLKHRIATFELL